MAASKQDLVDFSDLVWERFRGRLVGLTDEEYRWEPAPGCWSIGQRTDGRWRADRALPAPDPEPVTTIAWRLWHLIDLYGEDRAPRWLAVEPQGPAIGLDDPDGEPPATAAGALALLDRAHARWYAHLALVPEDRLTEPVGPVGGPYAERSRAAYVLHMLDEFVHHGAEVSLLRDLWRWQRRLAVDDATERAMRGDLGLATDSRDLSDAERSELVRTASRYARWELVTALVDHGAQLPTGGATPLHYAAGAGELDVVKLLVERGSDPTAADPTFHAPPIEWARFLHQPHVVRWLDTVDPQHLT